MDNWLQKTKFNIAISKRDSSRSIALSRRYGLMMAALTSGLVCLWKSEKFED